MYVETEVAVYDVTQYSLMTDEEIEEAEAKIEAYRTAPRVPGVRRHTRKIPLDFEGNAIKTIQRKLCSSLEEAKALVGLWQVDGKLAMVEKRRLTVKIDSANRYRTPEDQEEMELLVLVDRARKQNVV